MASDTAGTPHRANHPPTTPGPSLVPSHAAHRPPPTHPHAAFNPSTTPTEATTASAAHPPTTAHVQHTPNPFTHHSIPSPHQGHQQRYQDYRLSEPLWQQSSTTWQPNTASQDASSTHTVLTSTSSGYQDYRLFEPHWQQSSTTRLPNTASQDASSRHTVLTPTSSTQWTSSNDRASRRRLNTPNRRSEPAYSYRRPPPSSTDNDLNPNPLFHTSLVHPPARVTYPTTAPPIASQQVLPVAPSRDDQVDPNQELHRWIEIEMVRQRWQSEYENLHNPNSGVPT